MIQLSDLDTPFIRTTSKRVRLKFENGQSVYVTTNFSEEEFVELYLNKDINLSYYGKSEEKTLKLVSVKFY